MEPVVQWVRTSWTKQSRGGPPAAQRNAAPVALALPAEAAPLVHEVLQDESDEFRPHSTTQLALPVDGVQLSHVDGRLRVQLDASPWGMPQRHRRPPAVLLKPGEWVRWQINYRFVGSCGGDWSYRLDTLNVAHGQVSVDRFLGEPTYVVDERAYLR
ncbi:hypothetical protein ACLQ3D_03475 [Micromonospora vinacea]|uniref:hypothetical protein n=1 Tax=Micromonospora vinacea TaxID=709878 RepID=UPI003CF69B60